MSRALRRALQALAQPAAVQRALFPEFSAVGDELARVFDFAQRSADPRNKAELDAAQRIEDLFLEHGGAGHADFWDDLEHPRWEELRHLASRALRVHGWPPHKPTPYD